MDYKKLLNSVVAFSCSFSLMADEMCVPDVFEKSKPTEVFSLHKKVENLINKTYVNCPESYINYMKNANTERCRHDNRHQLYYQLLKTSSDPKLRAQAEELHKNQQNGRLELLAFNYVKHNLEKNPATKVGNLKGLVDCRTAPSITGSAGASGILKDHFSSGEPVDSISVDVEDLFTINRNINELKLGKVNTMRSLAYIAAITDSDAFQADLKKLREIDKDNDIVKLVEAQKGTIDTNWFKDGREMCNDNMRDVKAWCDELTTCNSKISKLSKDELYNKRFENLKSQAKLSDELQKNIFKNNREIAELKKGYPKYDQAKKSGKSTDPKYLAIKKLEDTTKKMSENRSQLHSNFPELSNKAIYPFLKKADDPKSATMARLRMASHYANTGNNLKKQILEQMNPALDCMSGNMYRDPSDGTKLIPCKDKVKEIDQFLRTNFGGDYYQPFSKELKSGDKTVSNPFYSLHQSAALCREDRLDAAAPEEMINEVKKTGAIMVATFGIAAVAGSAPSIARLLTSSAFRKEVGKMSLENMVKSIALAGITGFDAYQTLQGASQAYKDCDGALHGVSAIKLNNGINGEPTCKDVQDIVTLQTATIDYMQCAQSLAMNVGMDAAFWGAFKLANKFNSHYDIHGKKPKDEPNTHGNKVDEPNTHGRVDSDAPNTHVGKTAVEPSHVGAQKSHIEIAEQRAAEYRKNVAEGKARDPFASKHAPYDGPDVVDIAEAPTFPKLPQSKNLPKGFNVREQALITDTAGKPTNRSMKINRKNNGQVESITFHEGGNINKTVKVIREPGHAPYVQYKNNKGQYDYFEVRGQTTKDGVPYVALIPSKKKPMTLAQMKKVVKEVNNYANVNFNAKGKVLSDVDQAKIKEYLELSELKRAHQNPALTDNKVVSEVVNQAKRREILDPQGRVKNMKNLDKDLEILRSWVKQQEKIENGGNLVEQDAVLETHPSMRPADEDVGLLEQHGPMRDLKPTADAYGLAQVEDIGKLIAEYSDPGHPYFELMEKIKLMYGRNPASLKEQQEAMALILKTVEENTPHSDRLDLDSKKMSHRNGDGSLNKSKIKDDVENAWNKCNK